jgi:hypothetical protein
VEYRQALGGAVDPIEHEAVQMDVEIGGRAEMLDDHFARSKMGRTKYAGRGRATDGTHQRDGAGVGFGAFESRLCDQKMWQ